VAAAHRLELPPASPALRGDGHREMALLRFEREIDFVGHGVPLSLVGSPVSEWG
jgi:hypothetical protein